MRKICLRYVCAGLLGLAVAACSDTDGLTSAGAGQALTLRAEADGFGALPETRTQVGAIGEDGVLAMEWSVADRVGVFGGRTVNAQFKSTNTAPAARADFEGQMTDATDVPRYAYYPWAEGAQPEAVPVSIPTEQTYSDVNSVAQYDVKASTDIARQADGTYRLAMRQMAALVRFEIRLTDVDGLAADERLLRAELRTAAPVTGRFTYSLENLDAGLQPDPAGEQSPDINLGFAARPAVGQTIVAYAVVAPGAQQGREWHCTFITDRHTVTFTTRALCDFEAGRYYTLPLNAEVLANNQAAIEDVAEEEETANCYIVTETGEHDFLATVIGNGQKGIIPGAGFHTESARISPQSARLLWQDVEGFVSDVSLQEDGRVHYRVNSLAGNAVIAVYSGPDQTGDILWSWHIWGTGGEMPQAETYTNKAGGRYEVMDRTLGALSRTSWTATLYQWGRKDPFPNADTYYVDGQAVDIRDQFPSLEGTDNSLLKAVRHPDRLLYYRVQSSVDWLPEPNHALWGDTTFYRGVLTDAVAANTGFTYGKTIYDPSPVGWRVANKYTWTGFCPNSTGTNANVSSVNSRLDYINYVDYDHGYRFKRDATDAEGAYYPQTGWRLPYSGSTYVSSFESDRYTVGNYGVYWSASPQRTESSTGAQYRSWCLYASPSSAGPNATAGMTGNIVRTCDNQSRQNAYAVRCVRE